MRHIDHHPMLITLFSLTNDWLTTMTPGYLATGNTLHVYQSANFLPSFQFRFQSIGPAAQPLLFFFFFLPPRGKLQLQMKLIASVCNISPSIFSARDPKASPKPPRQRPKLISHAFEGHLKNVAILFVFVLASSSRQFFGSLNLKVHRKKFI